MGVELTNLVVIDTDCICSCKSNYHTITTTTAISRLDCSQFYRWSYPKMTINLPSSITDKLSTLHHNIMFYQFLTLTFFLYHEKVVFYFNVLISIMIIATALFTNNNSLIMIQSCYVSL